MRGPYFPTAAGTRAAAIQLLEGVGAPIDPALVEVMSLHHSAIHLDCFFQCDAFNSLSCLELK